MGGLNSFFSAFIPNCNRKKAFDLFCGILEQLRSEDSEGTECIKGFIGSMLAEQKKYKPGQNIEKDRNGKFVGRIACGSLTACSKAMQTYLFSGNLLRTDHFSSMRTAFSKACQKRAPGQFSEKDAAEILLDEMCKKYRDFGLNEQSAEELRKMKQPESALTWIMILQSVTPDTAETFLPAISGEKSFFMRVLQQEAEVLHCSRDILLSRLEQFVYSDRLDVPDTHLPVGETLLMLLWRWAQECIDVQDEFRLAQVICSKGLTYAETLSDDAIQTDIYPYVMCLYVFKERCCGFFNDLAAQEAALKQAGELEQKQRRRVERPDYSKIDDIPVTGHLRKREGLFWSRYRNIDLCQKSYFYAMDSLEGHQEKASVRLELTKYHNNLAVTFRKEFDLDDAAEWYRRAIESRREFRSDHPEMEALPMSNLAIVEMLAGDFDSARNTLKATFEQREKLKDESQRDMRKYVGTVTLVVELAAGSALRNKAVYADWITKCPGYLAVAQNVLKTYKTQYMSSVEQHIQANYWISEAIFLYAAALSRTGKIDYLKQEVEILKMLAPEIRGNRIGDDRVLYYGSYHRFLETLKWIEGELETDIDNPVHGAVPYDLRRYGVYYVKCSAGTAMAADEIRKPAAETHALFRKAYRVVNILLTDPSIRAAHYAVLLTTFYSVFLMRHPEEAEPASILAEIARAERFADDLSPHGQLTRQALQPFRDQLQTAKAYFEACKTSEKPTAQKTDIRNLILYLMIRF